MQNKPTSAIAFDIGAKRIGVAVASDVARLAQPAGVIANDINVLPNIDQLITKHQAVALVVGHPIGMEGQHTHQTRSVELFADRLRRHTKLPVHMQAETATSVRAEEALAARIGAKGKQLAKIAKGDIDQQAAVYILQDFLHENPGGW